MVEMGQTAFFGSNPSRSCDKLFLMLLCIPDKSLFTKNIRREFNPNVTIATVFVYFLSFILL